MSSIPSQIQAILDAEQEATAAITDHAVAHHIEFDYDGVAVAMFDAPGPIQLPPVGSTIMLHHVEVAVADVALRYAVDDGVQIVTAAVQIDLPAEESR